MNVYSNPQLIVIHGHEFARTTPWETRPSYSFKTIIMRNYLLSLISRLTVKDSLPVAAQKGYAVLTSDQTLTFYYDNQCDTHQDHGHIYDMPKTKQEPAWAGNDDNPKKNIKHVVFDDSFSEYRPISTHSWFAYCINLQDIEGIRNLNTEKVTDMNGMFTGCKTLTSIDVSNFDTQNVTDMSWMFSDCKVLTSLDVSKFNTQNVTDMDGMFSGCEALTSLDVSKFNTEKVIVMNLMFANCEAMTSLDVSNFNTQNVTVMNGMFNQCHALTSLDVSKFNTEKVTDMSWMFAYCEALTSLDLSKFKTEKVLYMGGMFAGNKALTSLDVSKFNTQNVIVMIWMFAGCESLTTIFCNSDWIVGRLIKDNSMFANCTKLKGTNTAYNTNKTGIEMANPTTGYFTSKTTGIDHVNTVDQAGDDKAYDLSGRRVNESYKGIVIKSGKKYIQK